VRLGVDVAPIDLDDPAAREWLAACIPPTTDAEQRLAAAIATVPDDALAVVPGRAAMRATVDQAGRDVVWISLDPLVPLGTTADRCVHDLPVDPDVVARNRAGGVFAVLSLRGTVGGTRLDRILATAHSSGTRMRWLVSR
jgi:hypothetical protein